MIAFKSRGLEIQWKRVADQCTYLRLLVYESACWLSERGHTLVITSLWREGSGPHGDKPCRACDVRTRDLPDEITDALTGYINGTFPWPDNPETAAPWRPTAIYETPETHPGCTAPHLHLQAPRSELGDTGWAPVLSPWDPEDRGLL